MTADGRFTGVFKLRYDRQTVSIENTQDVLFIQPVATYIMSPSRDTMLRSVGNFVAVLAQERNDSSVTFVVDAPFTYPEPWLGEYGDRDAPLGGFEMVMIWYRVYRSLIGARGSVPLEVHANIYPGEPNVFRYEFVTLDIDAPPQSASGQLTYAGGGYDAFGRWISENIKPPTIYLPYMLSSYN